MGIRLAPNRRLVFRLADCKRFNPRPGANSGATRAGRLSPRRHAVSIRAPERTPGRLNEEPDLKAHPKVSIRAPERTPGRPGEDGRRATRSAVSIRAPERTPGRHLSLRNASAKNHVSIRAPERTPGRLVGADISAAYKLFQSAPRSELRGDK